jgi:DNA polymerase III sliding clamp (beta) subunit (PCNA family)
MKIKTDLLKEILLKVKPGLASKGIVEQATHFIFTGEEVLTYNDRISISYPLKTDFGDCSVPAEVLYNIVKDLKGKETEIVLEKDQLLLKSGKTKVGINVSMDDSIMSLVDAMSLPDDDSWNPLTQEFIDGLKLCIFSASTDVSVQYLTCISVEGNRLVSGDELRISEFVMKNKLPDKFLIPAKAAIELVKFDIIEYGIKLPWIFFGTDDGILFSSKTVESDYPDVSEFFDVDGPSVVIPDGLNDSVRVVSPMSDGEFDVDKQVEISIEKGIVKCRSEGMSGWAEDAFDLGQDVSGIRFRVNPIFFLQVLDKETTMIHGTGRIVLSSGQFRHVVSLFD